MTPPHRPPTRAASQRRHPRRPGRRDGGSVAVEVAVSIPLGVLLVFLVVAAMHLGRSAVDVHAAAAAASRAASIAATPAAAVMAARNAAAANLAGHCTTVAVTVDTAAFHRGGTVSVTVACTINTHALTGLHLPGTVTTRATSTSPIDLYARTSVGSADSATWPKSAPVSRET